MSRVPLAFVVLLSLTAAGAAQDKVDYARDIRPIFHEFCIKCHGAKKQRGGLRLDSGENIVKKGSKSGAVVLPGKGEASLIIKALRANDPKILLKMPPTDQPRPSAAQIDRISAWITQGAIYPAGETADKGMIEGADHWAFQKPVRPDSPKVKNEKWARNAIDRFILARLEKEGLAPSVEADRATLIRRLSLDLLGLPPTPKEVEDFLSDKSPDAYEKLVERLLASPHYGERWGRHWLDLARYADSNGYSIDAPRSIWPYRDWVINAFNKDLPFDRFVIAQLAGDMLPKAGIDDKVATGFHRNTQINQEGGIDLEQFRVESIIDRVNTTGAVFLGLTVGCAQCHDHKYDPIAQKEYYELFAFFNNCDEPTLVLPTATETKLLTKLKAEQADLQRMLKGIDTASPIRQKAWEDGLTYPTKATFPADVREFIEKPDYQRTAKEKQVVTAFYRRVEQIPLILSGLEAVGRIDGLAALDSGHHVNLLTIHGALEKKLDDLKKREPKPATTMVLQERAKPRETHVMIRGDFLRKGKRVAADVPEVFPRLSVKSDAGATRLDFARWLVSTENPLTARVFVNRLWQQYFGRGLVETENDFGAKGTPPSHPDLLDWLAAEFMTPAFNMASEKSAAPWSIKHIHRLIVTSAAYRQSSAISPEQMKKDPQNRFWGRQTRLRLEAEVVRDVALASSGLLNRKIGGPSVFPPQPEGVFAFTQVKRDWKADTGPDRYRRGMYTFFWRSAPHPALMAFDSPDGVNTCTRRVRSNTPLQALTLLNDKAFFEYAQGLAERVLSERKGSDADRLRHAFRLCLARDPSAREESRLLGLLGQLKREFSEDLSEARKIAPVSASSIAEGAAWTLVSRVLLNLDEFITRE
ncbi:MAG: PSD1 and planctomycete cytochrome C domain-containing protein [Gemmataceae bacterium]